MKHCMLAPLPGRGSLAGEILSHDFVEAALMRRAGYGVWIAYDLDGSYEETPPNLIEEVKRDRRWCHGNLMNARLMFARGMHPVHRWVFLTGALAYLSAPLWLGFLCSIHVAAGRAYDCRAAVLRSAAPAFPVVAVMAPGARGRAVCHGCRGVVPAQDSRCIAGWCARPACLRGAYSACTSA